MNLFKAATLSAAMLVASAIAANAQQSASAPPVNPPQVTTSSGFGYSSTRTPGPSTGHSTWIPSDPSSSVAAAPGTPVPSNRSSIYESASSGAQTNEGHFYSKKGFGPAPN
jgi:hypothetical protein